MKVKIDYFKRNGKWYSEAEYETRLDDLWMIWREVWQKILVGDAPGLAPHPGESYEFIALVDVPDHPYRHPHIVGL